MVCVAGAAGGAARVAADATAGTARVASAVSAVSPVSPFRGATPGRGRNVKALFLGRIFILSFTGSREHITPDETSVTLFWRFPDLSLIRSYRLYATSRKACAYQLAGICVNAWNSWCATPVDGGPADSDAVNLRLEPARAGWGQHGNQGHQERGRRRDCVRA